ncbi:3839_t:CDS:2 [Entrophospora sp. SA101]|nr:3839_t:CDS:2 [Entrophospora sp. SA101]
MDNINILTKKQDQTNELLLSINKKLGLMTEKDANIKFKGDIMEVGIIRI